MSDQQEKEATKALTDQLNNAGPVNNERADAIAKEDPEDIDAFLAELEAGGDADASSDAPKAPAEEDPFAAAFADLEMEHDDVELPPVAASKPEPKPEPEPTRPMTPAQINDAKAKAVPEEPTVALAKTPEADTPEPEKEDPKASKSKKKRKSKKDDVAVVEKVRSPGFRFAMGTLKFSAFFIPAMLCWWLIGSFASRLFETGWMIAIVATLVAFIVPGIARLGLGRGKYGWWALLVAVLVVGGLVGAAPQKSGESIAKYGHWPASTVSQLAKWDVDNASVTASAVAAEFIGQKIATIRAPAAPADAKPIEALALGTEESLEAAAKKQEEQKATDTKTNDKSGDKSGEKTDASKNDAKKEDAKKEDVKKEEVKKPAEKPAEKSEEKPAEKPVEKKDPPKTDDKATE